MPSRRSFLVESKGSIQNFTRRSGVAEKAAEIRMSGDGAKNHQAGDGQWLRYHGKLRVSAPSRESTAGFMVN